MMCKKICFVVQRYGLDVNGGAETHCRLLAEHMKNIYEKVDVLTTCAIDHISWANYYPAGEETINGIRVIRHEVERERNIIEFSNINRKFLKGRLPKEKEKEWLMIQGPYCPTIISFIRNHLEEYEAFIFFTYLYYPTVMGVPAAAQKAILIPTAHDEPFLYMDIMKDVFSMPRAIFYNTEEEKELVWRVQDNRTVPNEIGGIGIEVPQGVNGERFQRKHGNAPYILYTGRIEEGKNLKELFRFFIRYKRIHPGELKLILMGKVNMHIPQRSDIISLGFVDEEDKYDGMSAAKCLVMPSKYESLSMVVLEAMALGTQVMVNSECTVLEGHCKRSGAALSYHDYKEFEKHLDYFLSSNKELKERSERAKSYVAMNYTWDMICSKLEGIIKDI